MRIRPAAPAARAAMASVLWVAIAACAAPGPSPSPAPDPTAVPAPEVTPGPRSVLASDGPFQLELELERTTFSASEPVTGQGILSTTDGTDAALAGSGGGLVHFSFEEIGGTRRMDAAWTDDCTPWTIGAASPIVVDLRPAGGWSEDDPNAEFYEAFARAPDVRLPPGAWQITALAHFMGPNCAMPPHELTATTVIVVTP